MFRKMLGIVASASLGGCAFVPNLEDERFFSYAEVATQIECETFLAITKIEMERHFQNRHDKTKDPTDSKRDHLDYAFKHYVMSIELKPNLIYDGSVGLGFTDKTSATAKKFFQFTLGGGTSPGGAGYESYGAAYADNTYIFPVSKLFDPTGRQTTDRNSSHEYSMDAINPDLEKRCRPSKDKAISDVIRAMVMSENLSLPNTDKKRFTIDDSDILHQDAVPNILDYHGLFGIYDFLDRSFAVNDALDILPYSIGFSKQYKTKVNVGVTPGWYVATGNTSPSAGVVRTVDNTVTVVFTPADKDKIAKTTLPPAKSRGAGVMPPSAQRFAEPNVDNGVSQSSIDRAQQTNAKLQLQGIQNQLNFMFR